MNTYLVLFVVAFAVAVEGHGSFERFGPERGGFGGSFGGFGGGYPEYPGGYPGGFGGFPRCPPCPAGQYLPVGATTCACVACTVAPATCVAPKVWDTTTCRCGCAALATPCTIYQVLNPTTCACACRFPTCPWTGAAINPTTCQC